MHTKVYQALYKIEIRAYHVDLAFNIFLYKKCFHVNQHKDEIIDTGNELKSNENNIQKV